MKHPHPSSYPLSPSPLHPTTTLLFHQASGPAAPLSVYNITTSNSAASLDSPTNPPIQPIPTPSTLPKSVPNTDPILQIEREAWYRRTFHATTPTAPAATFSGPLLALGHWSIEFPPDSPHSSHDIELRPVGIGSREDVFIQDSVVYFWDVAELGAVCKLFRVVEGNRAEVARFVGKGRGDRNGVMVVDEEHVDVVVAVVTCAAVLNRSDSFRK